jgi:hypothetical protein
MQSRKVSRPGLRGRRARSSRGGSAWVFRLIGKALCTGQHGSVPSLRLRMMKPPAEARAREGPVIFPRSFVASPQRNAADPQRNATAPRRNVANPRSCVAFLRGFATAPRSLAAAPRGFAVSLRGSAAFLRGGIVALRGFKATPRGNATAPHSPAANPPGFFSFLRGGEAKRRRKALPDGSRTRDAASRLPRPPLSTANQNHQTTNRR